MTSNTWFKSIVEPEFDRLKSLETESALADERLLLFGSNGYLEPVGKLHLKNTTLISTLADWRRQHEHVYPTRFKITHEGTADWLDTKVVAVHDRIMFLVLGSDFGPVGHLGFALACNDQREMKLDNLLLGVWGKHPGIMSSALETLLSWSETKFGTAQFMAPPFAHNARAVAFLQKHGFESKELIPLRRHQRDDRETFEPIAAGDDAPADAFHNKLIRVAKSTSAACAMGLN